MAVLSVVRHHGRLAEVVIPVQSLRNGLFREWTIERASGQTDDDMLEFAEAAVADVAANPEKGGKIALLGAKVT
ncbi:MAG: hypothetical protein ABI651_14850, partial [Verrucomicrobiota bacterium]